MDISEQKGKDFEDYVVNKFYKKYWTLNEWRSDKITNGTYAESSTYPDMEWNLKLRDKEYRIAVERKWRVKFDKDNKIIYKMKSSYDISYEHTDMI